MASKTPQKKKTKDHGLGDHVTVIKSAGSLRRSNQAFVEGVWKEAPKPETPEELADAMADMPRLYAAAHNWKSPPADLLWLELKIWFRRKKEWVDHELSNPVITWGDKTSHSMGSGNPGSMFSYGHFHEAEPTPALFMGLANPCTKKAPKKWADWKEAARILHQRGWLAREPDIRNGLLQDGPWFELCFKPEACAKMELLWRGNEFCLEKLLERLDNEEGNDRSRSWVGESLANMRVLAAKGAAKREGREIEGELAKERAKPKSPRV